jgi:organic hydroperoxide reductase OsmC/OhrA
MKFTSAGKITIHADTKIEGLVGIGLRFRRRARRLQHRRGTEISVPGMDKAAVKPWSKKKTRKVCPYSNATRGNIDVTLTVSKHRQRQATGKTPAVQPYGLCRFFTI